MTSTHNPDDKKGKLPAVLTTRIQLMISPEEVRAIDEYRWPMRLRSQAAAVRRLVQIGLKSAAHSEVVMIGGTGHYVSPAVADEIDRLRRAAGES